MSSEEGTNPNNAVFNAEPEGELGPKDVSMVPMWQTYMRVTPELRSLIERAGSIRRQIFMIYFFI